MMKNDQVIAKLVRRISHNSKGKRRTPNQIAKYLQRKGCKGYQMDGFSCPVHFFLNDQLQEGELFVENVASKHVYFYPETDELISTVDLPANVREFIYNFDHDKYPSLVQD